MKRLIKYITHWKNFLNKGVNRVQGNEEVLHYASLLPNKSTPDETVKYALAIWH